MLETAGGHVGASYIGEATTRPAGESSRGNNEEEGKGDVMTTEEEKENAERGRKRNRRDQRTNDSNSDAYTAATAAAPE